MAKVLASLLLLAAACSASDEEGDVSSSIGNTDQELKGCHGKASSTIPSSGTYYVTTFGNGPGDDGIMSCGTYTKHGSWYYAASRQRYTEISVSPCFRRRTSCKPTGSSSSGRAR